MDIELTREAILGRLKYIGPPTRFQVKKLPLFEAVTGGYDSPTARIRAAADRGLDALDRLERKLDKTPL